MSKKKQHILRGKNMNLPKKMVTFRKSNGFAENKFYGEKKNAIKW